MTNFIIFLADDLGYSDLGAYGGEIRTPNLDRLAQFGVRLSNFHNTPRCSPSRASLLTGLHPHQTGMGILANDNSTEGGYRGKINDKCVTIAEILRTAGYATAVRGKWHLTPSNNTPDDAWPTSRGFDSFFGTLTGCGSYYQPGTLTRNTTNVEDEALDPDFFYTDAIADEAVQFLADHHAQHGSAKPYFLYVPFTAPHWPLHARPETIASYDGMYDVGWDVIRERRFAKQKALGVIPQNTELSPRDPAVQAWDDEPNKRWQARRMEVYAAMVTEMDTAIGRVLDQVRANGDWEDTVIVFLADNGASSESIPVIEMEDFRQRTDILRHYTRDGRPVHFGNDALVMPGPEDTYGSYGRAWANVSNTPYRMYKLWTHEGGIASPFIVHWPNGDLQRGEIIGSPYQLVNVLPTILEIADVSYPQERQGVPVHPLTGESMLQALRGAEHRNPLLWWEHCGNAALIRGEWKLVRQYDWPWELYNLRRDRSELVDLADEHPDLVRELAAEWEGLAEVNGVIPFKKTLEIYKNRNLGWNYAIG